MSNLSTSSARALVIDRLNADMLARMASDPELCQAVLTPYLASFHCAELEQMYRESFGENPPDGDAQLDVAAEAHSDDRVFEVAFDASAWMAQASEEEVRALAKERWRTCEAADHVAYYFEDQDSGIAQLLAYCRRTFDVGFEVSVDEEQALAWLKTHRLPLWAILMCEASDVRLVQATEPEVAGRWDWLHAGDASDMSLATEGEAALDALQAMGLLED